MEKLINLSQFIQEEFEFELELDELYEVYEYEHNVEAIDEELVTLNEEAVNEEVFMAALTIYWAILAGAAVGILIKQITKTIQNKIHINSKLKTETDPKKIKKLKEDWKKMSELEKTYRRKLSNTKKKNKMTRVEFNALSEDKKEKGIKQMKKIKALEKKMIILKKEEMEYSLTADRVSTYKKNQDAYDKEFWKLRKNKDARKKELRKYYTDDDMDRAKYTKKMMDIQTKYEKDSTALKKKYKVEKK